MSHCGAECGTECLWQQTLVLAAFFSVNEIAQNVKREAFIVHTQHVHCHYRCSYWQRYQPRMYTQLKRCEMFKICDLKHFCAVYQVCLEIKCWDRSFYNMWTGQ